MTKTVMLDSGPLGRIAHPRPNREITEWLERLLGSDFADQQRVQKEPHSSAAYFVAGGNLNGSTSGTTLTSVVNLNGYFPPLS